MIFDIFNLLLVVFLISNQPSFIETTETNSECQVYQLRNGYVTLNKNNDTATIHCNKNYSKNKDYIIYCSYGMWINQFVVRCIHNDCLNSPLHYTLRNGYVSSTHRITSKVDLKYTCRNNYELNGPWMSRCIDGKWSNPPPVCKSNVTENASFIENKSTDLKCYPYKQKNGQVTINERGDRVTVNCNSNYSKTGDSNIYCSDGMWKNKINFYCKHNDCLNSPLHYTLENGIVSSTRTFSSDIKLEYSCRNDDYELEGFRWSTCIDGRWSNTPPVCKFKDLKCTPFEIENGQVTINEMGDRATVKCNSNYSKSADLIIYCSNGIWMNKPQIRCIHNDCLYLLSRPRPLHYTLEHGHVFPKSTDNSDVELEYRCKNDDYELIGFRWSFCRDGKWSNPPPVCELNESEYEGLD
ncbi:coagulation factor XIII B chain-like [Leptopilina boulardi]|uniref:coagulation factor XIII B chain-like n=1 Tax=Leptopilina boulardi TaxID=63433 RepID=UPI0021F5F44F|nr:coagulation factor XIII B chain-like [Leptopilina boulardi]